MTSATFATRLHRWAAPVGATLYVLALAVGAAVGQAPGVELSPVVELAPAEEVVSGSPLVLDGSPALVTARPRASGGAQVLRVYRFSGGGPPTGEPIVTELALPPDARPLAVEGVGRAGLAYLYLEPRGDSAAIVLASRRSPGSEPTLTAVALTSAQAAFAKTSPALTAAASAGGHYRALFLHWTHAPDRARRALPHGLSAAFTFDARGRSHGSAIHFAPAPAEQTRAGSQPGQAPTPVALALDRAGELYAVTLQPGASDLTLLRLAPGAERFAETPYALPDGITLAHAAWSQSPADDAPHLIAITQREGHGRRGSYGTLDLAPDGDPGTRPRATAAPLDLPEGKAFAAARGHDYRFTAAAPLADGRVAFLREGTRAARAHPKATHVPRRLVYTAPTVLVVGRSGEPVEAWTSARQHTVDPAAATLARASLVPADGGVGVLFNDHPANLLRPPHRRAADAGGVAPLAVVTAAPGPTRRYAKRPVYGTAPGLGLRPASARPLADHPGAFAFLAAGPSDRDARAQRIQVGLVRPTAPPPAARPGRPREQPTAPAAPLSSRLR